MRRKDGQLELLAPMKTDDKEARKLAGTCAFGLQGRSMDSGMALICVRTWEGKPGWQQELPPSLSFRGPPRQQCQSVKAHGRHVGHENASVSGMESRGRVTDRVFAARNSPEASHGEERRTREGGV